MPSSIIKKIKNLGTSTSAPVSARDGDMKYAPFGGARYMGMSALYAPPVPRGPVPPLPFASVNSAVANQVGGDLTAEKTTIQSEEKRSPRV
jgi:hypothetical protein